MHRDPFLALDGDRAAQAIEGQPPGKVVRGGALAINQQIGLVAPDQEIEQHFALRRSEEHTSELQSLMRISYAVFTLKKKNNKKPTKPPNTATPKNNTTNN